MQNAVVVSDDKYGTVAKLSVLDRLMDTGQEYQYLLESKDRGVMRDKLKIRKFSKRVNRINNMLHRYHPEYILCVTPYAHHCAVEAKKKIRFTTKIIYVMMSFSMPKRGVDETTDTFIVENQDIKTALVRTGIPAKDIVTLGLPIDIKRKSESEIVLAKKELGLPSTKTAFVSISDKEGLENVFSLLLDQGNIASLVVKCENAKLRESLSFEARRVPDVNIIFVASSEKLDDFLAVSDVAIASYDSATIYKCMKLGVPCIVYSEDEHLDEDIGYLASHELIARAKQDIEVVGLYYKLLQTDLAAKIAQNGIKRTENSTFENIVNFLITYINV